MTKIEWADFTRNPVVGCWGPGGSPDNAKWCDYCFARSWAERRMIEKYSEGFIPRFFPELLADGQYKVSESYRSKNPNLSLGQAVFFMVDMGDLFGDWVDASVIEKVIDVPRRFPQHKFLFLTKNPSRYKEFKFSVNSWLGTTITGWNTDETWKRLHALVEESPPTEMKFVSFEPLLGNVASHLFVPSIDSYFGDLDWVIIGKMTGLAAKTQKYKYVLSQFDRYARNLAEEARKRSIPVLMKDNSGWPDPPREWPKT